MKTERIIERLYEVAKTMESDDLHTFERNVQGNIHEDFNILPIQLANLVLDLQNDLRTEEMRKNGKNTVFSAAKRILKSSRKTMPDKPVFHYPQVHEDGKQCVMDQYHAVIYSVENRLPLEPMPENIKREHELFPIQKSIPRNNNRELVLPDISDLKSYIKIKKARGEVIKNSKGGKCVKYDFGEDLPAVRAEYLLDMLECMPNAKAYVSAYKPTISGIYFKDGANEGVLLPIKK